MGKFSASVGLDIPELFVRCSLVVCGGAVGRFMGKVPGSGRTGLTEHRYRFFTARVYRMEGFTVAELGEAKERSTRRRTPIFWPITSAVLLVLLLGSVAVIGTGVVTSGGQGAPTAGANPSPSSGSSAGGGSKTPTVSGSSIAAIGTTTVVLSADAKIELRPGVSTPLNVSFANQGSGKVSVSDLVVSIARIIAPAAVAGSTCSVSDFIVTQIAPTFAVSLESAATATLASSGTPASGWPTIGMLNAVKNQDGCKGATITLSYSASGVAA